MTQELNGTDTRLSIHDMDNILSDLLLQVEEDVPTDSSLAPGERVSALDASDCCPNQRETTTRLSPCDIEMEDNEEAFQFETEKGGALPEEREARRRAQQASSARRQRQRKKVQNCWRMCFV